MRFSRHRSKLLRPNVRTRGFANGASYRRTRTGRREGEAHHGARPASSTSRSSSRSTTRNGRSPSSVRRLHDFLAAELPFSWQITIADNASTDRTPEIARTLAASSTTLRVLQARPEGSRPRAARRRGRRSLARVVAYMDVDLSTDLRALLPLVAPLLSGHSEVAIGSAPGARARVTRGPKREFISRSYNLILRAVLRAGSPTPSAASRRSGPTCSPQLLAAVRDEAWFFDTELLVARPAARDAHPRGAGRLGRRSRLTRRHRLRRRSPTCAASRGSAMATPVGALRRRSASPRRSPTRCCSCALAGALGSAAGQRRRAAAHRGRPTRRPTGGSPSAIRGRDASGPTAPGRLRRVPARARADRTAR